MDADEHGFSLRLSCRARSIPKVFPSHAVARHSLKNLQPVFSTKNDCTAFRKSVKSAVSFCFSSRALAQVNMKPLIPCQRRIPSLEEHSLQPHGSAPYW